MTDEEFEGARDWDIVAQGCQRALAERGVLTQIVETGLMDEAVDGSGQILSDYSFIVSVYSFPFKDIRNAEISLCGVRINASSRALGYSTTRADIPRELIEECQPRLFAIARLNVDPGVVVIEPMELGAKLKEFFDPLHVSIPGYNEFRHRHSCRFDSPEQAAESLTEDFLKIVDDLGDAHVEIRGDLLVAGFKREFKTDQLFALATFIREFGTVATDTK